MRYAMFDGGWRKNSVSGDSEALPLVLTGVGIEQAASGDERELFRREGSMRE